jgi:Ca2+/Na+ antiporter
MPYRIKEIGIWGNGAIAVAFVLITLILLGTVQLVAALFCAMVAGLCAFNVYVIRTAAAMTSEEEWLKSEIRKAELRKTLATYDGSNEVVHVGSPPTSAAG